MAATETGSSLGRQIVEDAKRYVLYSWSVQDAINPIAVERAEGRYFYDYDGNRYLDFASQLVNVSIGHSHPKIVQAIKDQAEQLATIGPPMATASRSQLGKLLAEVTPGDLSMSFFTNGGAEANENAIKLARWYTGRHKIIARYRSYHGSTSGSIAATGDPRRWAMEPRGKGQGIIFGPEVHCYKCPIKHTYPQCGIACADYLEHMIRNESDVAAILVEPIVGTNGVLVPPDEYMPKLRRICDEYGVLMIADEVMAGWGRAGEWFAIDLWGVTPDILTTAKGITSAYVPLGLCATSEKIGDFFQDHYFAHGHTYEAHPMTLAPAVATIREMQRLKLVERARELGPYVEKKLQSLKEKHRSVGDVRGKGLFWAVDLVKNRETKEAFNTYADKVSGRPLLVDQIAGKMLADGVIMQAWVSHFVIAPPLIVTREELDRGINALDQWLHLADEQCA
jgi:taurine--2-oxoglutarate transaminase